MGERPDFKSGLWGLDPHKVSAYLRQLRNLQDQQLTELEARVQVQRVENARLLRERDTLLAAQRDHAERLHLHELMMSRAGDVLQVMKQHTQQEIAGLQRALEQKQAEHRRKIDGIEHQTDHYNQVLHTMLQEFGATMHKFTSSSFEVLEALAPELNVPANLYEPESVPEQQEQEVESQPSATQEQTRAVTLDSTSDPIPDPTPDLTPDPAPEQPSAKGFRHDKVIQFKVKSIAEKAAQVRNAPAAERIEAQPQVLARQEMAAAPQVSPKLNIAGGTAELSHSSAFWGNIQPYVGHEVEAYDSAALPVEPIEDWLTEDIPQAAPPSVPESPVYEPEESKESEAVSTEIMSIRNRYIVGKLAGEDLHDIQGRLIVSKGATITPEMVDLAEKAGRLPDLIVSMKIAGVSDDKR
ncbi:hypothetical protein [Tumebacillus permanentifrigoris]|uniref:Uncharacterized protein n=1 Tax=Tumebacillus permanentifrigoris TaxID=378543 RepID=A0A316DCP0_9BACL|nr:hypothetical protein [Tumebacillus permanentifrigoris]PWK14963.1 hypothetical protein C7459_104167 [Tumebacillus permanentifrigoris]